jgi:3-hydroxybutyryl-CoA dehydratase
MTEINRDEIRAAIERIDPASSAKYVREITAELIATFAHASGDCHRIHLDADYAAQTPYGRRIAHGALLVGFMSTASTLLSEDIERQIGCANVSLGYDRVRFLAPVFEGDTVKTEIRIVSSDPARLRVICEETCTNQSGETVAVAQHLMRFI